MQVWDPEDAFDGRRINGWLIGGIAIGLAVSLCAWAVLRAVGVA